MSVIPHAAPAAIASRHGFFSRYLREISVAAAYAILLLLLGVFRPAFFTSHDSAQSQLVLTWVSAAPMLVLAVGMTLVILARHIDISIGSQFSVCCNRCRNGCRGERHNQRAIGGGVGTAGRRGVHGGG